MCYANTPFSQLAKVLTKIAFEGTKVALCTPKGGIAREHAYWRRVLDRMTTGSTELPNGPIYVPKDSQKTMPALEWGSFLSIVDGSLNPVPASDFDQVVLKGLMAKNCGLTLHDVKKTSSEYPSVTATGGECFDEAQTAAISPPMANLDDHLSEIASVILPVHPEVLTLKHSAFVAQLLLEEMDVKSTGAKFYDQSVLSMQLFDSRSSKVPGAKLLTTTCLSLNGTFRT